MRRLPYKEADGIPSKGVWSIVSALANKSWSWLNYPTWRDSGALIPVLSQTNSNTPSKLYLYQHTGWDGYSARHGSAIRVVKRFISQCAALLTYLSVTNTRQLFMLCKFITGVLIAGNRLAQTAFVPASFLGPYSVTEFDSSACHLLLQYSTQTFHMLYTMPYYSRYSQICS